MMRYFRAWIIALVVTTVLFGRQIANFSSDYNRIFWNWDHTDAAILIGLVVGLASLATAIYAVLRAIGSFWLLRVAGHAWVALLIVGILSNFDWVVRLPLVGQLAWSIPMLAALTYSVLWKKSLLVDWAGKACLVFFLLPVILLAPVPLWRTWGAPRETYIPAPDKPNATPIFIFSFDSMAWPYVGSSNGFKGRYPNLCELAKQAYVFTDAHSSATKTAKSLPNMIYQVSGDFRLPKTDDPRSSTSRFTYTIKGRRYVSHKAPGVFAAARQNGYQTCLVTFYLPWRHIVGPQADYVHVYPQEPKGGDRIIGRAAYMLLRNLYYYPYPGNQQLWKRIYGEVAGQNWSRIVHDMEAEADRIIQTSPSNVMAFFHFPVPHGPFVLNTDGSYRGSAAFGNQRYEPGYLRHLKYADAIVGRLVQQLKKSGKYDRALIIVTADHGWSTTRNLDRKTRPWKLTSVPLVIKIPGQTSHQLITQRISNNALRGVMQLALQGRLDEVTMLQEMARIARVRKPSTQPQQPPSADVPRSISQTPAL